MATDNDRRRHIAAEESTRILATIGRMGVLLPGNVDGPEADDICAVIAAGILRPTHAIIQSAIPAPVQITAQICPWVGKACARGCPVYGECKLERDACGVGQTTRKRCGHGEYLGACPHACGT